MGDPSQPALEILPKHNVLELRPAVRRHLESDFVPLYPRQVARLRAKIGDRVHVLLEPQHVQREPFRRQDSLAQHADGLVLPIRSKHGAAEFSGWTALRRQRRHSARTPVHAHILTTLNKVDVVPAAHPNPGLRCGWRHIAIGLLYIEHCRVRRNRCSISDDKRDLSVILNLKTKI